VKVKFVGEISIPNEEAFDNTAVIDRWILDVLYFNCSRPTNVAFSALKLTWSPVSE
jgi:hypothetical protein